MTVAPFRVRLVRLGLAVAVILGLLLFVSARAGATPLGTITTVVGTGAPGFGPWPNLGTSGLTNSPDGVAFDAGNNSVYIADSANCDVLRDDLTANVVSVAVNAPAVCGPTAPPGTPAVGASLGHPAGLAVNETLQILYVADPTNANVTVVGLSTGMTQTSISTLPLCASSPSALSVDQSTWTLYMADDACQVVWKIPFGGVPSDVAGVENVSGFNGNLIPATTAFLRDPTGLDFDTNTGILYIGDTNNNEVRAVSGGTISDVAGSPVAIAGCSPDGSVVSSPIGAPSAVGVDSTGTVFFDEDGCDLVREAGTATPPLLQTVAGTVPPGGISFPYAGNPATAVALSSPHGLAFVPATPLSSDLWFSDTGNNVVDTVTGVAAGAGSISLSKSTSAPGFSAVGQAIVYDYLVTNTGATTLNGVSVSDNLVPAVQCPSDTLAPGANETCTGTYSVTAADLSAGSVTNSATVMSTSPYGSAVSSAPSVVTVDACTAPVITSPASAGALAGSPFTFTVTTCSTSVPALKAMGLPKGLTLTDNGDGTASIAGTPGPKDSGPITATITARVKHEPTTTQNLVITVANPGRFTSKAKYTDADGGGFSFPITTAHAFPTPTISASPLPGGVTLTDNQDGTATLADSGPVNDGGIYGIIIVFNGGPGVPPIQQSFTLTLDQVPMIAAVPDVNLAAGIAMTPIPVPASGFPAPKLKATGLPQGVKLIDGTISGTPKLSAVGAHAVTITANNKAGTATQSFTMNVFATPSA